MLCHVFSHILLLLRLLTRASARPDMKPPYLDAIFLRSRIGICFTFWLLLLKLEIAWSRGTAGRKFPDFVNNTNPVPFPAEKSNRHVCSQKYRTEAETDYQTFELWKNISGSASDAENYWSNLQPKNLSADDKYKIVVVPMTHVDPGWLKTFDEYAIDTNRILTFMLQFLKVHKEMRFTWCEMVFFERWWQNVTEDDKRAAKSMVDSGQLELTSGSWVMTDEANPYFPITVDNIVEGHQFLKKELDVTPKVMWSNDPFGYGPSVTYLFRKAGIKNAIINRVHHEIKVSLQKEKIIPFKWRQFWDASGDNDVLTYVLPFSHYDILNSCGPFEDVCCQFDFKRITDFTCPGPKPVPITEANVADKAEKLFDQLKRLSSMSTSPVVMMVLGDDFRFDSESEWSQQFDNFIPLFKYMNEKFKNVEIGFGTYSDYFRELEKWNVGKGVQPKSLSGDFFPYSDDVAKDYWTGYFTTRPFYKRRGLNLHAHIRAADVMSVIAFKSKSFPEQQKVKMIEKLTMARRQLSLFQHHDAITGTSRVNVMENYGQLLWSALNMTAEVIEQCSSILLCESKEDCLKLNELPPAHNNGMVKQPLIFDGVSSTSVAVYNSLPNERIETISLHVRSPMIKVSDGEVTIDAQIEPILDPSDCSVDEELFQLIFHAKIPALSFKVFHLTREEKQPDRTRIVDILIDRTKKTIIFPELFKITSVDFSEMKIKTSRVETFHEPSSGYLMAVAIEGIGTQKFVSSFHQYNNTRSGAYIFAPLSDPIPFPVDNALGFVTRGPLQQTVHVHVARLYQSVSVREVPGPEGEQLHISNSIDLRSLQNHELVIRFTTDLNLKNRQFFADNIGFQMLRREAYDNLPVEANYYPMPTAAFMQDNKTRVTVLGDVPHGVTSPQPGQLEIMLDRILSQDDGKGLGVGPFSFVNDNVPVTIGFRVVFEAVNDNQLPAHFAYHSSTAHLALQALLYPPMVLTSSSTVSPPNTTALASFPCDVQLLTNRPLPSGVDERLIILTRPGIDCQVGTTPHLCNNEANINESMRAYLKSLGVTTITETNLGGVEALNEEQNIESVNFETFPMDVRAFKIRL